MRNIMRGVGLVPVHLAEHLPCICPISALYLPYISRISRLHLGDLAALLLEARDHDLVRVIGLGLGALPLPLPLPPPLPLPL